MILDWISAAPVILIAALVVFVPGMLPLRIIGVRGLALVALAPVLGTAIAAGSAILLDWTAIPWIPPVYVAVVAGVALIAWALRLVCGPVRQRPSGPSINWTLSAALAIGVALSAWSLIAYIGPPGGISQTNDSIFHLNAVRYAIESASASSFHITGFTGSAAFYPAAWHGLVSMLVQVTGAQLPIAVNALTLLIGAVIWPLGVAWLTKTATGSAVVSGYSAVLSGALQAFPLLMFQWGVLYPNALSIAILPAAIALVVTVPRWVNGAQRVRSAVPLAVLFVIVIAALLLSQPSTVLVWGVVCALWLTFCVAQTHSSFSVVVRISIVATAWLALAGLWFVFARNTSGSHWPTFRGKIEATADVLINRQMEIPAAFAVSILMLVGLAACIRFSGRRWMAASWLALSLLYIAVASVGSPALRAWLLGPWYADPNRIAALAPVLVIPLAAIGVDTLVRLASRLFVRADAQNAGSRTPLFTLVGFSAVTVLVVAMTVTRPLSTPSFTEGAFFQQSRYEISDDTFLSIDERSLLEALPEHIDPAARVIGNPSTGIGFGYALANVDVFPKTWAQPTTDAWRTISAGLRNAASDPAICEALAVLGDPQYVLDFGPGEAKPGRYVLPEMTDFEGQEGFELVLDIGHASLWRITACDAA